MRLAVFDVGGTAIKYAAMTDGEMDGKGEVPTPATCSVISWPPSRACSTPCVPRGT